MIKYFQVHPSLQEYIEYIAFVHYSFSENNPLSRLYTFVPTHTRFITFYLGDPVRVKKSDGQFLSKGTGVIIGPQLTSVTLDLGADHRSFIVAFKPGCMHRLIKVPLRELVDLDFNSDDIMGAEAAHLNRMLRDEPLLNKQFNLIQQFFYQKITRLKPILPFDYAMQQLVRSGGNLSMDDVAGLACLSLRQFERYSLERIGHSPKSFARIVRFSNAYKLKELSPDLKWSVISHRCGYFDQMHFIRDFKQIAGFLPKSLLKEDIENSVRFQKLGLLGEQAGEQHFSEY